MLLCKNDAEKERPRLPIARVEQLFQYHTMESLQEFYARHRELLLRSTLLLVIPKSASLMEMPEGCLGVSLVTGLQKPVYPLDTRLYAFLNATDQEIMKSRPRKERSEFLQLYQHCMFHILQAENALMPLKRKRDVALEQLQEVNTTYRIQLALAAQREQQLVTQNELEKQLLLERHEAEKQKLRDQLHIEYQNQQLFFLMQQQQQQQQLSGIQGAGMGQPVRTQTVNRTVTMNDWLNKNYYTQDLTRLNLINQSRWFNLFENVAINIETLYSNIIVDTSYGSHSIRLLLPLTYRYRLKRVLFVISASLKENQRDSLQTIINACPDAYTVILYGGVNLPDLKHRINCTILAVHCHLVMAVDKINHQNAKKEGRFSLVLHDTNLPAHMSPSLDLLASHYPSSVYFGPGTFLTHDFTIPLVQHRPLDANSDDNDDDNETRRQTKKQKKSRTTKPKEAGLKGIGTGHGKCCPYCCFPARTLSQGDVYKESHQPINCPFITLCSRNEAEILEHIRLRCSASLGTKNSKKNKIATHKYIVGKEAKKLARTDVVFAFDRTTVMRHATPEELDAGAHDNGLRLNRQRFVESCRDVYDTLKTQIDGPLFGELNVSVARSMSLFRDMEQDTPLRSLLYDEFGEKFVKTRFHPETKKPLRTFDNDDGLYFSLDSTQPYPQTMVCVNGVQQTAFSFYCAEYQNECLQQRCYLGPAYTDRLTL